jgi:hypothetical protein
MAGWTAFNPAITQLTTNNHLSLYKVPATCFGLSFAIMAVSNKGT